MSKEVLSQGEIDALLRSIEETGGERFTDTEKEALIELTNLVVEAAAAAMSTLTNREVEAERPEVILNRRSIVEKNIPAGTVCLSLLLEGAVSGQAMWAADGPLMTVLTDILLGGDGANPPDSLSETHLSTLKEAYQNALETSAAGLSEALGERVKITVGAVNAVGPGQDELPYFSDFDPDHLFLELKGKLGLPDMVDGEIRLYYPSELARELLGRLTARQEAEAGEAEAGEAEAGEAETGEAAAEAEEKGDVVEPTPQAEMVAGYTAAKEAKPKGAQARTPKVVGTSAKVQVQPAKFESLKPTAGVTESQNLDLIMDVPLHLTVELGRTKMQVRQILALGTGTVIELDKLAGEPLDVMVNGRLIAKGEVVIINENFGVRITDVISQIERVQNLR